MKLASESENVDFCKFYDKKNTIKRCVLVNEISDISLDNIGCHWTSNMSYVHVGGGQNGFSQGKVQVTFFTSKVGENKEATKISRENFYHEKEVVLNQNTELKFIYVLIFPISESGNVDYKNRQLFVASGNSGDRVDKWVLSL